MLFITVNKIIRTKGETGSKLVNISGMDQGMEKLRNNCLCQEGQGRLTEKKKHSLSLNNSEKVPSEKE